MTLLVCLLAFAIGLFIGWLGLRAIGWLCVLLVPLSAVGSIYHLGGTNVSGLSGCKSLNTQISADGVTWSGGNYWCLYNTQRGDSGVVSGNYYGRAWWSTSGLPTNPYPGDLGAARTGGLNEDVIVNFTGAPPADNYCWACASWNNPCSQAGSVTVLEAGAGGTRNDGTFAVLPGQTFTICATNTDMVNYCPFQLILSTRSDCRDPSVITVDSSSGYLGGSSQGNNNPQIGGGGNNTTNAPTGSGGTNVASIDSINALIRELQLGLGLINGQLQTINGNLLPLAKEVTLEGLTNQVAKEGTLRVVTNQLESVRAGLSNLANQSTSMAISNLLMNMLMSTSYYGAALSNAVVVPYWQLTNFLGTNGYQGVSNTLLAEGLVFSNAWVSVVDGRASGIWTLTNDLPQLTSADSDLWKYTFTNYLSHSTVVMDLNPLHSRVGFVFDWCKLGLKMALQVVVFLYMMRRIQEEWIRMLHTPGVGVGKMNPILGLTFWFKSNMVFGSLCLAILVFGTGALDTFLSASGGWWASPFSSGVFAGMGDNAKYLRGALEVIEGGVPLAFIFLMLVLVVTFDLLLSGHVVFWTVLTRRTAE